VCKIATKTDLFDKINNKAIVNSFKQISSEAGNREVSLSDVF